MRHLWKCRGPKVMKKRQKLRGMMLKEINRWNQRRGPPLQKFSQKT